MYSNNIVNFQESMPILNAHTKKVWKLIVCTSYPEINQIKAKKKKIQLKYQAKQKWKNKRTANSWHN